MRAVRFFSAFVLVVLIGAAGSPAQAFLNSVTAQPANVAMLADPVYGFGIASPTATAGGAVTVAQATTTGITATQAGSAITGAMALSTLGISAWTLTHGDTDAWPVPEASGGDLTASYHGVSVTSVNLPSTSAAASVRISYTGAFGATRNVESHQRCSSGSFSGGANDGSSVLGIGASSPASSWTLGNEKGSCQSGAVRSGIDLWVDGVQIMTRGVYSSPAVSGQRWIEQTVTCKRANGTTHEISSLLEITSWDGASSQAVGGLDCPAGEVAIDWQADVTGTGVDPVTVGKATAPDYVGDIDPSCFNGASCVARLQQLQADGETWVTCNGNAKCVGWWSSPQRSTLYRCQYGSQALGWTTVGIGVCSVYRDDTGTLLPPISPDQTTPANNDASCDLGWGDLLTGQIVQKAVGCALTWAFVPDPAVVSQLQTEASAAWSSSGTGQFMTGLIGVFSPLAGLSSAEAGGVCGGVDYEIPLPHAGGTVSGSFLDSCVEPWSTYAPWVKGFLTAFVIVDGAWYLMRIVGSGLGWYVPAKQPEAPSQLSLF